MSFDQYREFNSLTAAHEAARKHPEWGKQYAAADHGDGQWSGGTYAQADSYIQYGWHDGATQASEASARIVDRVVSQSAYVLGIEYAYDVTGGTYDIGAYCSGVPECWIRPQPTLTKRAIHICTHIGAHVGIRNSTILNRGMAVASLALALVATGHPVTVDVAYTGKKSDRRTTAATVIRVADASSGSPLDVDRVVYAMAHPTALRLMMRALTAYDEVGYAWDAGCVTGSTPPTDTKYDLFLTGIDHLNESLWANPEAWVLQQYKQQTESNND